MKKSKIQEKVDFVFNKNFGYTPLSHRLEDIQNEFFELMRWKDVKNLKEETGDILASLLQLCNENDWIFEELIENTFEKIERRRLQYQSLGRKTKIALFGGAFNPITIGHIQAAQFILNTSKEFDEVWIMPAYKHMHNKEMASPEHRLEMCRLAAKVDARIKIFDYEIRNQLSGDTYHTISKLMLEQELNERYNFSLVIGLDNANTCQTWAGFNEVERMIRMVIVPRKGYEPINNAWYFKAPHIYLSAESTIIESSSTQVRELLSEQNLYHNELLTLISPEVLSYILDNKLY